MVNWANLGYSEVLQAIKLGHNINHAHKHCHQV